jgi:hypothetical protein
MGIAMGGRTSDQKEKQAIHLELFSKNNPLKMKLK